MKANTRLLLSAMVVIGSAVYGFLILEVPRFAEAIALWYIAVLLTILATLNLWKG